MPDAPEQFQLTVNVESRTATSVGGESDVGRKKRWMQRFFYGVVPQRGRPGSFVIKEWFQKRKAFGNWSSEKVIDEKTKEVLHECHEPLDEHLKHGSAKPGRKAEYPRFLKEHRAEDVGVVAGTRHAEEAMRIVEFDCELQVLLDDVLDRDWRLDNEPACARILGEQCSQHRARLPHRQGRELTWS
jgi:hypothetical protein